MLLFMLSLCSCAVLDEFRRAAKESDQSQAVDEIQEVPDTGIDEAQQPEPDRSAVPAVDVEVSDTEAESQVPDEVPRTIHPEVEPAKEVIGKTEVAQDAKVTPAVIDDPAVQLCEQLGAKLGSVSVEECLMHNLVHSAFSTDKRSMAFKDYPPLAEREPLGKVLVIGGIHGDEFSSVSVIIKWMHILDQHHSGLFHWRFVPTANPDGLLKSKSQRQNLNGVDLNRNFPTADWDTKALENWKHKPHQNPRRHPGHKQASELETQWLVKQIDEFKPDVIISMHAPLHLVDYDGPPSAPDKLGGLYLHRVGVYPGSLGNYAGVDLQMPIVTVELKAAGIMPGKNEINRMWRDLVGWLRGQLAASIL